MKRICKLLVVLLSLFIFVSCGDKTTTTPTPEFIDYVSQVKLTKDFVGKDYVKDKNRFFT